MGFSDITIICFLFFFSKGIDTTVKDINVELLTPSNDPKPLSKRQTKQMQRLKPHEHYLYKTRYQVPKGIADSVSIIRKVETRYIVLCFRCTMQLLHLRRRRMR